MNSQSRFPKIRFASKLANTPVEFMHCRNCNCECSGREGEVPRMGKSVGEEYLNSLKYINSCHAIINQLIQSSIPEQSNVTIPDLPNFLAVLDYLANDIHGLMELKDLSVLRRLVKKVNAAKESETNKDKIHISKGKTASQIPAPKCAAATSPAQGDAPISNKHAAPLCIPGDKRVPRSVHSEDLPKTVGLASTVPQATASTSAPQSTGKYHEGRATGIPRPIKQLPARVRAKKFCNCMDSSSEFSTLMHNAELSDNTFEIEKQTCMACKQIESIPENPHVAPEDEQDGFVMELLLATEGTQSGAHATPSTSKVPSVKKIKRVKSKTKRDLQMIKSYLNKCGFEMPKMENTEDSDSSLSDTNINDELDEKQEIEEKRKKLVEEEERYFAEQQKLLHDKHIRLLQEQEEMFRLDQEKERQRLREKLDAQAAKQKQLEQKLHQEQQKVEEQQRIKKELEDGRAKERILLQQEELRYERLCQEELEQQKQFAELVKRKQLHKDGFRQMEPYEYEDLEEEFQPMGGFQDQEEELPGVPALHYTEATNNMALNVPRRSECLIPSLEELSPYYGAGAVPVQPLPMQSPMHKDSHLSTKKLEEMAKKADERTFITTETPYTWQQSSQGINLQGAAPPTPLLFDIRSDHFEVESDIEPDSNLELKQNVEIQRSEQFQQMHRRYNTGQVNHHHCSQPAINSHPNSANQGKLVTMEEFLRRRPRSHSDIESEREMLMESDSENTCLFTRRKRKDSKANKHLPPQQAAKALPGPLQMLSDIGLFNEPGRAPDTAKLLARPAIDMKTPMFRKRRNRQTEPADILQLDEEKTRRELLEKEARRQKEAGRH